MENCKCGNWKEIRRFFAMNRLYGVQALHRFLNAHHPVDCRQKLYCVLRAITSDGDFPMRGPLPGCLASSKTLVTFQRCQTFCQTILAKPWKSCENITILGRAGTARFRA